MKIDILIALLQELEKEHPGIEVNFCIKDQKLHDIDAIVIVRNSKTDERRALITHKNSAAYGRAPVVIWVEKPDMGDIH